MEPPSLPFICQSYLFVSRVLTEPSLKDTLLLPKLAPVLDTATADVHAGSTGSGGRGERNGTVRAKLEAVMKTLSLRKSLNGHLYVFNIAAWCLP